MFRVHKGQLGAPQGASCELNFNGFLKNLPLGTLIFLTSGFVLDWVLINIKYLCMVACMFVGETSKCLCNLGIDVFRFFLLG